MQLVDKIVTPPKEAIMKFKERKTATIKQEVKLDEIYFLFVFYVVYF